jgi:hypothetical protein
MLTGLSVGDPDMTSVSSVADGGTWRRNTICFQNVLPVCLSLSILICYPVHRMRKIGRKREVEGEMD